MKKKILILAGGFSREREISLKTATSATKVVTLYPTTSERVKEIFKANNIELTKENIVAFAGYGKDSLTPKAKSLFKR